MSPDAEALRQALRCGRAGCPCARRRGPAHCPVHNDARPSLSVGERGGRLLVRCHAGCGQAAVLEALRERGLWPERTPHAGAQPRRSAGARETRFEVRNCDGQIVAVHVRKDRADGKVLHWERPDGSRGLGGLAVAALPLFGVHLLRDRPGGPVIVCEGEKAAQALLDAGRLAVGTVTGAAGTPGDDALRPLAGRDVLVWPDADEPGQAHMSKIASALVRLGVTPRIVTWAEAPPAGDAADFLAQHGAGEVLDRLLAAAAPFAPPTLAALLGGTEAFVRRYVAFPSVHEPVAVALWSAHTYVWSAFDVSPFLRVSSPEKRSGKTRLLEALEVLVRHPWRVVSPSEAVLFRKIAADHPTLLLDECDATFSSKGGKDAAHEPLRALLNAGNRRGVRVPRCVGDGARMAIVEFDVFAPRALASIGPLPDTIEDRSVPVRLQRRAPHEPVDKFRYRDAVRDAAPLRDGFVAWGASAEEALRAARPDVPASLHDRAAETWEPLLAVADLAGGPWPERARAAAVALHGDGAALDETAGVVFLRALHAIFDERGEPALATADLLAALVDRDDTPAAEWWGKALRDGDARGPARRLARLLRPYGIEPARWGSGAGTTRGYRRSDFTDAWARYLSSAPSAPPRDVADVAHVARGAAQGLARDSRDVADNVAEALMSQRKPLQDKACDVATLNPPSRREGQDETTAPAAPAAVPVVRGRYVKVGPRRMRWIPSDDPPPPPAPEDAPPSPPAPPPPASQSPRSRRYSHFVCLRCNFESDDPAVEHTASGERCPRCGAPAAEGFRATIRGRRLRVLRRHPGVPARLMIPPAARAVLARYRP
jgi:hypothetical protein